MHDKKFNGFLFKTYYNKLIYYINNDEKCTKIFGLVLSKG